MLLRRQFSAADIHLVIRCLRYGNKKSSTPQYNRWRHLAVLISSRAGGDINANEITLVVHRCPAAFCLRWQMVLVFAMQQLLLAAR